MPTENTADPLQKLVIRGGADKFLGRPGRKQTTATKLGIYSTYSPLVSPLLWLLQATQKKNSEGCPSNHVSAAAMTPRRTKNGDLSILFESRGQVVVRRGQIRRIGWVIKTLEAQVGQFLLGCKCPVSRGIVVQEQDPLRAFTATFFFQNVLQLHQQRSVIHRVNSLALWKIINAEESVLIPKNGGEKLSSWF